MTAVARIWKAAIDPTRGEEYESFARTVSVPMFQQQPGFTGVAMLRNGSECVVISFWRSLGDAEALKHSESYRACVTALLQLGLLRGEQVTSLMDLHLLECGGFSWPS